MERKPYVEPEVTEVELDFSEVMTYSNCNFNTSFESDYPECFD